MKKILFTTVLIGFIGLPGMLWAQEEDLKNKETEEIVIRKNGDKEMKLSVEINGDKIIVNGKPLAEFKDDQITINKRKMIIRDGDKTMAFDFGPDQSFNFGDDMMKSWGDEKEVIKPFLGVTTEKSTDGAVISEVVKESAAEKAGLKKDDVITKVGDAKVTDAQSLANIISSKNPGDEVKVYYKRDGKEKSRKIKLGERKEKRSLAFSFNGPNGMMRSFKMPKIEMFNEKIQPPVPPTPPGFDENDMVERFDYDMMPRQKKLGLKIQDTEEGGNVKVIDVEEGSAAATADLKKDDIITEIDGKKINNTDDAREQLKPDAGKTSYKIKATRGGKDIDIEIKIPKKLKTANL